MSPDPNLPPPLPSPGESLAGQFQDWERRGRGWQVWNDSAYLEPPFRPFFHIYIPPAPMDDGRRPTLASRLVEKVSGFWSRKPEPETIHPNIVALLQEPEIPPYEDTENLIELQVALPTEAKVSNDTFSSFLLSLAFCSSPLSFEVIGTAAEITVQIVAREVDAEEVEEQLRSHFPEASLRVGRQFLQQLWLNGEDSPAAVVDFGLSEEFMRPLECLPTARDPLVAVTGALSKLRDGEIGMLQVLFESVRHPWAESIFRAVTDSEGDPFFENAPELVPLAREKIRSPLYAAVVRVAAKSPDDDRPWQIARNLGGALAALSRPQVNELIPLDNETYDDLQHEADVILRQTRRSGMILNSEELVSLVHLPSAAVKAKKLKRQTGKSKRVPAIATGHSLLLGRNDHEDTAVAVSLSADQRVRHTHVLGAPGTGKSTFLEQLILQDIEAGHGLALLDPHGDLVEQVLERVKEERRGDVILFDPSDSEFPVGFNILSAHSEIEKNLLASDLVGVFKRLSTSWGDQMTSVLGNAILSFLESKDGGTLADLRRFLIEKEYREAFLKTVQDPQIVYYWKKEFPMLTGGKSLGPLLTRLDTFLRPKLIRHVVAQRRNKLDFRAIMDGNKIFLAKLSQGAIGEENAWLLGSLLVAKFHQIALARQDKKESERPPFFLYVDEFHNFITPSMTQILSGARKYRLGLILAHQELRQLGGAGSEIGSAVLANPYTRVCFRLGDEDARKIEGGFSFFEAKDFQNLGTGEAICRVEKAENDFNLTTAPLPKLDEQSGRACADAVIESSRRKYGTPRAEVEAELLKNAAIETGEEEEIKGKRAARKMAEREEKEQAKAERAEEIATKPVDSPPPSVPPSAEPRSSPPVSSSVEPSAASPFPSLSSAPSQSPAPSSPPSYEEALQARAEEGVPEPPTVEKPKPASRPAPFPPLGRGGAAHKALQQKIALWAQGMGWRAVIEKEILEGAGSVDVALENGTVSIACEISMTTGVEQEVGNIEKCLGLGFTHVALIARDQPHLAKIRRAALEKFGEEATASVRFLTPETFFTFMDELTAQSANSEATVMGYKVKKSFGSGTKADERMSGKVARGLKKTREEKK